MLTQTIDPVVGAEDSGGAAIALLMLRAKPFCGRNGNEARRERDRGGREKAPGANRARLTFYNGAPADSFFHLTQKSVLGAKFV